MAKLSSKGRRHVSALRFSYVKTPNHDCPMIAVASPPLSMEDETGIMNAIVTPATFDRYKFQVLGERFLLIDGVLQNLDGVISVKAGRIAGLGRARRRNIAQFPLMVSWTELSQS